MSMILDGTNGATFNDGSLQAAAASPYVLKNRIINGDCRIDQRNAGASITPTDGQYTVDRWYADLTAASKFTVSQNAGSVTPPSGFVNYLGVTSSSAYSISATDIFTITQKIEGYNISDFAWGTANAKTVTLSFWVRSSLTGTFGGALRNNGNSRNYPFTYSIPTANTWTQISVTIAGETSGTWLTTNGNGLAVAFGLGVGSTYSGTAGAWTSSTAFSATGATSVVGTNGATFYITGVQLEIGTSATPFERRLYGQELANCQRYYWKQNYTQLVNRFGIGLMNSASSIDGLFINLPTPMRTAPTMTFNAIGLYDGSGTGVLSAVSTNYSTNTILSAAAESTTNWSAINRTIQLYATSTASFISASAEL